MLIQIVDNTYVACYLPPMTEDEIRAKIATLQAQLPKAEEQRGIEERVLSAHEQGLLPGLWGSVASQWMRA